MTSQGAMNALLIEHLDKEKLISAKHIHIGGFFSLPMLQTGLASLIVEIRASNPSLTVSLDTNYDASEAWAKCPGLLPLLEQVDVFLPNEVEATGISGEEDLEKAALWLASKVRPGGAVVLTIGEKGALCAEHGVDGAPWHLDAPKVTMVDSTGAGDAFNAAFLFEWVVQGASLKEAIQHGIRGGSTAVQHEGACDTLLTSELLRNL
mmetsp:Transcript_14132/g.26163  ORF Transcript_14132/g.26163 Transcript_14132/m.26163 type:complete len:207 (+) Transcript_14132:529-1149(+)